MKTIYKIDRWNAEIEEVKNYKELKTIIKFDNNDVVFKTSLKHRFNSPRKACYSYVKSELEEKSLNQKLKIIANNKSEILENFTKNNRVMSGWGISDKRGKKPRELLAEQIKLGEKLIELITELKNEN